MGILSYIREELNVVKERDPAIKSNLEVLLYPSFKVILNYRVAHKLYRKKHYFLARWISQRAARKQGLKYIREPGLAKDSLLTMEVV